MDTKYGELFKDDKLNIQSYVVDFAHLIEQESFQSTKTSKVYSIDAEFGIGKTFFCNHLMEVLKKDGVRAVKLNIWEMDFYADPFMPILSELNELYKKNGGTLPTKILNAVKNISKKALVVTAETGIKAVLACIASKITQSTGDVVNPEDINPLNSIENQCDSYTIYTEFQSYKESLEELKDCLSRWAQKEGTPIVMIIDELDRCKPDYAVKTLETLKHFFDIPGFVFVLAIDEKQLKNSVKTLFGATNFDGYKRKFINNTFFLPSPDRKAFTEFLYDKSEIDEIIQQIQEDNRELVFTVNIYDTYDCAHSYSQFSNLKAKAEALDYNALQTSPLIIKRYFAAYSEWFSFSLRQMEQVFDRLVLFVKEIAHSKQIFSPDLAVLLICLHEFDINIYNLLRKETQSINIGVLNKIGFTGNNSYFFQIYGKNSYDKLNLLNRQLVPECITLPTFSEEVFQNHISQVIKDNVDRFFIFDNKWRLEQQTIETKGILVPEKSFDVRKFNEDYFKRMDFISHFE